MNSISRELLVSWSCLSGLVLGLMIGSFYFHYPMLFLIISALAWTLLHAYLLRPPYALLTRLVVQAMRTFQSIIVVFMLIGALIASLTVSGTLPWLMDKSAAWMSVSYFLPLSVILCGFTSLCIGTCWGTLGTTGLALYTLATFLPFPPAMVIGAIISGAYFGDKLSPLSDTTLLSAYAAQVSLTSHIRHMSKSLIPALWLTLILFYFLGHSYHNIEGGNAALSLDFIAQLHQHFNLQPIVALPLGVLACLSLAHRSSLLSLTAAIFTACIIAITQQHQSWHSLTHTIVFGPSFPDIQNLVATPGSASSTKLLDHGGLVPMLQPALLSFLILCLGHLLAGLNIVQTVLRPWIERAQSPLRATLHTMFTCLGLNLCMGEAYLSIILSSELFKPTFDRLHLHRCTLSKALEQGATFSTPLIPWTTSGTFIIATLRIEHYNYIFWSLLNWIAPLCFIILLCIHPQKLLPKIKICG